MHDALRMLNHLIDAGWEYPDAEFHVALILNMSGQQLKKLKDAYDNQY
ncbi:MAG TPA: hypothetical protein VK211_03670 [Kamptonema sp.]|nr:hypothetical protein [Kamptonema sp.]